MNQEAKTRLVDGISYVAAGQRLVDRRHGAIPLPNQAVMVTAFGVELVLKAWIQHHTNERDLLWGHALRRLWLGHTGKDNGSVTKAGNENRQNATNTARSNAEARIRSWSGPCSCSRMGSWTDSETIDSVLDGAATDFETWRYRNGSHTSQSGHLARIAHLLADDCGFKCRY